MAGNAVVQKPDTQTALTALWSMGLMYEAGLPADVWQMVIGRGSSIGGVLMEDADYMMFTGSTATGRRIASDADKRLIAASLELGGKNAMIVLDDADIEKAAEGAVHACFPSAGQLCVPIERLYVAESVRDEFTAARESIDAPVGGMGDSGLGRRHGTDGILKYTEAQTVAHQRLQGFHPPSRIGPETWATLLTGALKVMKAVGVR